MYQAIIWALVFTSGAGMSSPSPIIIWISEKYLLGVLVYGDCCHAVDRIEKTFGVARTQGVNCCEMLLGRGMYKSLMKEGVFFLLPEWTRRWEEVFTHELGLSQENAQDLMQEMHTRLVYLDTGIEPVPSGSIAACSAYCGLPVEIRQIPLTHLQMLIEDAMGRTCMEGT